MVKLVNIYSPEGQKLSPHVRLWELLAERTPEQSISHQQMPTLSEHIRFIDSQPYLAWYFILLLDELVGCIYLTHQREIGISIYQAYQGNGYAKQAIGVLMQAYPGEFYANINPANKASINLFTKHFGGKLIQHTYKLGEK